jgi:hypothetical protein
MPAPRRRRSRCGEAWSEHNRFSVDGGVYGGAVQTTCCHKFRNSFRNLHDVLPHAPAHDAHVPGRTGQPSDKRRHAGEERHVPRTERHRLAGRAARASAGGGGGTISAVRCNCIGVDIQYPSDVNRRSTQTRHAPGSNRPAAPAWVRQRAAAGHWSGRSTSESSLEAIRFRWLASHYERLAARIARAMISSTTAVFASA